MNKPDSAEDFIKADGFFKRAKDAGGRALRTARDAGKRAWERATDAPDEDKRRKKILTMLGLGIAAVIAVLFTVSRIGGDNNIEAARTSDAQAVSVVAVQTQTFETEISLNGEARPVRDVQVTAQATGVRILQILVDEGDFVRQGQAMARLGPLARHGHAPARSQRARQRNGSEEVSDCGHSRLLLRYLGG